MCNLHFPTDSSVCDVYINWALGLYMNFLSDFNTNSFFYPTYLLYSTSAVISVAIIVLSLANVFDSSFYFRRGLEWLYLWLIYHPKPQTRSTLWLKAIDFRAAGWLSRLSFRLQLRSRPRGPWVRAPRGALGWWLRAWSLLPILCVSLSLPLPRSCSVCLCLKNK